MRTFRRFIGLIGLLLMALGFWALLDTVVGYVNSNYVEFTTVDKFLRNIGLEDLLSDKMANALSYPPAFFTFAILGIFMAWWGLKELPPKPKFRK